MNGVPSVVHAEVQIQFQLRFLILLFRFVKLFRIKRHGFHHFAFQGFAVQFG